jgi:hypothetical protein
VHQLLRNFNASSSIAYTSLDHGFRGILDGVGNKKKVCRECHRKLVATTENFYAAKTAGDGLEGRCKDCRAKGSRRNYKTNRTNRLQQTAAWQANHPEEMKTYYKRHNAKPERKQAGLERNRALAATGYFSAYYQKNKKHLLALAAAWRTANQPKVLGYRAKYSAEGRYTKLGRIWRAANPESNRRLSLAKTHRRRARKLENGVEPYDFEQICERDGWRCQICKRKVNRQLKFPDPLSRSVGHIIPISEGGPDAPSNVRLEHLKCNLEYRFGKIPAQLLLIG